MRYYLRTLTIVVFGFSVFPLTLSAEDKKSEKKEVGHCEKKDGTKMIDLDEAKDKKTCKQLGGRWSSKAKGHDEHGHKDGDKHEEGNEHDDKE